MAARKKAATAGAGAIAAGQAARDNAYVKRLMDDTELRDSLRAAFESARKAYGRMNGKGPSKVLDDKRMQRDLREAANSLKSAAESLRQPPKRKRGRRMVLFAVVGAGLALALNEDLRKKILDALFGAEEEFEYSSSTTSSDGAPASTEPVTTS